MPVLLDYPSHSLFECLKLAQGVERCDGSCTKETCAEYLKVSISGTFHSWVSSTVKFGFITNKQNTLSITESYKSISLAYTEKDKKKHLIEAFFSISLYKTLHEQSNVHSGEPETIKKYLQREYQIPKNKTKKVCTLYLNDCAYLEIESSPTSTPQPTTDLKRQEQPIKNRLEENPPPYNIRITSPHFNIDLDIQNNQDLAILDTIRDKINHDIKNHQSKSPSPTAIPSTNLSLNRL